MNVPKKNSEADIEAPDASGAPAGAIAEEDEEQSLPEADPADNVELLEADADAEAGSLGEGRAAVIHYAKLAPSRPGVYRMLDGRGDVLYVGKAKNIKKRVTAYARPTGLDTRIERMIAATRTLEFVVTRTETEALLLEANLIKRLRPRFNVVLRDDKSFPYILITTDHWAPQILKHRGARTRPGQYYGPFASVWAVNRTINALQRAFLLRSCSDPFFESRSRPCLLYQIKRCSAPCTNEIEFKDRHVHVQFEFVDVLHAVHVMHIVMKQFARGVHRNDRLQSRRMTHCHLERGESSPRDAKHAHTAVRPRLTRQPRDHLFPVDLFLF